MRKPFIVALLLGAVAVAGHGQALVYEVDDKPLFSIEVPEGWVVDLDFADEAREAGTYQEGEPLELRIVEIRPGDGGKTWVGLWAVPKATNLDEAEDYIASLNQDLFSSLEISRPTDRELNGMPARTAAGTGVHQGEDVEFILALFEPASGTVAAGLYVGAVDAWQSYVTELEEMVASLEPAG